MLTANVWTAPTAAVMHLRSLYELNTSKTTQNAYLAPPPVLDGLRYLATTSFPITETQGTSKPGI